MGVLSRVSWSQAYSEQELCAFGLKMTYEDSVLEAFGLPSSTALQPGGESIEVSRANVAEYLHRWSKQRLLPASVVRAIAAFTEGLFEVIPCDCVRSLTAIEMQSLLCGVDVINAQDIADHTEITPCGTVEQQQRCEQVRAWLLGMLERASMQARRDFLVFVTGLQRLPLGGAGSLRPRIHIHMNPSLPTGNLPVSHTCSNQLEIPLYADRATFEHKLQLAIRLAPLSGFGVA